MDEKKLLVSALENGTVLDHIPSECVYRALDILNLKGIANPVTIGINLKSKSSGDKGIIKISGRFFGNEELDRLAVIAPEATVNIIKDFKVIEKHKLKMPEEIVGITKCMNPKCITNHQPITTRFKTLLREDGKVSLLCHYCEKITDNIE